MKQFRVLPIVALVSALVLSAFTYQPVTGKQWRFKSDMALEDARDYTSYEDNFGTVSCGGSELPCIIEVPHIGNNTDLQDLQSYLTGFSSDQDVVDAAITQQD
jgi:hypothetical protein